jgi:hypothetical protein
MSHGGAPLTSPAEEQPLLAITVPIVPLHDAVAQGQVGFGNDFDAPKLDGEPNTHIGLPL